jgi:hypothetical protein
VGGGGGGAREHQGGKSRQDHAKKASARHADHELCPLESSPRTHCGTLVYQIDETVMVRFLNAPRDVGSSMHLSTLGNAAAGAAAKSTASSTSNREWTRGPRTLLAASPLSESKS